jgi:uncharacterized protein
VTPPSGASRRDAAGDAPSAPFLTARWEDLVMANFPVAPALLAPLVPRGTELDAWGGTTWLSLVAFRFRDTRVRNIAIPFHRDFEEVNLRFYVRRPHPAGERRGVVFVKEVVPRRAIALVARLVYHEPYVALPTRSDVTRVHGGDGPSLRFSYAWRQRDGWSTLEATAPGDPSPVAEGSLESFIAEHYWGYNRQPDGATMEYRVDHPPWRVWRATASRLTGNLATLYGAEFARALTGPPASVFVAEGSPVVVFRGRPLVPS